MHEKLNSLLPLQICAFQEHIACCSRMTSLRYSGLSNNFPVLGQSKEPKKTKDASKAQPDQCPPYYSMISITEPLQV